METALVRLSMPGGVGGQRREPLPTLLEYRLIKENRRNYHTNFTGNRSIRRNSPVHIQGSKPSCPCIAFPLNKDNSWTGYPRKIPTPG